MQRLLDYMRNKYGNPPVFIHENGNCSIQEADHEIQHHSLALIFIHLSIVISGYPEYSIDPATCGHEYYDEHRANYIKDYIESMLQPIRCFHCLLEILSFMHNKA